MVEKRAYTPRRPRTRLRATSMSGWATALTYAPSRIGARPAEARVLRARSMAGWSRAGSAPTEKVIASAIVAAIWMTRGPVAATDIGTRGRGARPNHSIR